MTDLTQLRLAPREIFDEALRAVDPAAAVSRTVRVYESRLIVQERASEIPAGGVYSIAIGKAAYEMAGALEAALVAQMRQPSRKPLQQCVQCRFSWVVDQRYGTRIRLTNHSLAAMRHRLPRAVGKRYDRSAFHR